MPPPSLLQLCMKTAMQHVKTLSDIGHTPYSLARPFLNKIENPTLLRSIELQSPHIMKYNGELWFEMIRRNIPHWDEYAVPEPSECSYEVYSDLRDQIEREVELDAQRLKKAIDLINKDRAKHESKFVTDRRAVRLPKPRPTKIQKFALHDRRMGGIDPVYISTMIDGRMACVMEKPGLPSPEKQKSKVFAVKRNKALAIPTHRLTNKASQIKQAPRSLIEEHKYPLNFQKAKRQVLSKPAADGPSKTSDRSGLKIFGPSTTSSSQPPEKRLQGLALMKPERSHVPITNISTVTKGLTKPSPPMSPCLGEKHPVLLSPKPQSQQIGRQGFKLMGSQGSLNDTSKSHTTSSPPPAAIKKRSTPNIFIQPKKKKIV